MNQQELDALLVATDMPRAVTTELRDSEIKLRIDFARPEDPNKIAEAWGKIVLIPSDHHDRRVVAAFAKAARDLISEKRPSLVPYDSIYRADNDNAPALEVAA